MSPSRNFQRGPGAYRRGKPRFPLSGHSFLIVTEGEKTEPQYFMALRDRLHLSAVDVEIVHPEGTDPKTLVDKAKELQDTRKREAKAGNKVEYDEVWVVFDLEKTHDRRREEASSAKSSRNARKIAFAISDPCFEYWLVLHERFTTSPCAGCDDAIALLRQTWGEYEKGVVPSPAFIEKVPSAVIYSERVRKYHKSCGGDGNPSSYVDCLVRSLNAAARPYYRFAI